MADRHVWLIEPNETLRGMLRELFEQAHFTVRECCATAKVLRALLRGESGIVVADATQLKYMGSPDLNNFGRLSQAVGVLLLSDEADLAAVVSSDLGSCKVLYRPYDDVDELVRVAVELAESGLHLRNASAGVF